MISTKNTMQHVHPNDLETHRDTCALASRARLG